MPEDFPERTDADVPYESTDLTAFEGEAHNASRLHPVTGERQVQLRHVTRYSKTSHSGPLPPISYIRELEEIVPGAAERLLAMSEKESAHRHGLENKQLDAVIQYNMAQIKRSSHGLMAGFVIGLTGLAVSGACILHGHDVAGGTIGATSLVSLVSTFVVGKVYASKDAKEDAEKETVPEKPVTASTSALDKTLCS